MEIKEMQSENSKACKIYPGKKKLYMYLPSSLLVFVSHTQWADTLPDNTTLTCSTQSHTKKTFSTFDTCSILTTFNTYATFVIFNTLDLLALKTIQNLTTLFIPSCLCFIREYQAWYVAANNNNVNWLIKVIMWYQSYLDNLI